MTENAPESHYATALKEEMTKHMRQLAVAAPTIGGIGAGAALHMVAYNKELNELSSITNKIDDAQEIHDKAMSNQAQLEGVVHTLRDNNIAAPKRALDKIAEDQKTVSSTSAEIKQLTSEKPDIPSNNTFLVAGAIICALVTWGAKKRIKAAHTR